MTNGSEKQIKWAEEIKAQAIEHLSNIEYGLHSDEIFKADYPEIIGKIEEIKFVINGLQNAGQIIKHREDKFSSTMISRGLAQNLSESACQAVNTAPHNRSNPQVW